jgi:hypothetical protein
MADEKTIVTPQVKPVEKPNSNDSCIQTHGANQDGIVKKGK